MQTQMRLTGMASGLDTDAIIQNLGRVHTLRVDAVKRDRQTALWKQETLRSVIASVQNFQRANLNTANPLSNFRSPSAFAKFSYSLAMNGIKTEESKSLAAAKMSVTANGDLKNFNQSVQAVAQLASKDSWSGETLDMRGIKSNGFNLEGLVQGGSVQGAIFDMAIDGVSRRIEISAQDVTNILNSNTNYTFYNGQITSLEDFDNIYVNNVGGMTLGEALSGVFSDFGAQAFADIDPSVTDLASFKTYVGSLTAGSGEYNDAMDKLNDNLSNNMYGLDEGGNPTGSPMEIAMFKANDNAASARIEAFAKALNTEITKKFGKDYDGMAQVKDGELKIDKSGSSVAVNSPTGMGYVLDAMGFSGGASSANVNNVKLGNFFGDDFFTARVLGAGTSNQSVVYDSTVQINGVSITLNKDDTIGTMISKINGSNAGVTLAYSSASGKFSLESKQEGTASAIQNVTDLTARIFEKLGFGETVEVKRTEGSVETTGHVLAIGGKFSLAANERIEVNGGTLTQNNGKFQFVDSSSNVTTISDAAAQALVGAGSVGTRSEATNLIAVINGEQFLRQTNSFAYEGMTYSFNATFNVSSEQTSTAGLGQEIKLTDGTSVWVDKPSDEIKIEVAKNTTEIMDSIKSFVSEYNKIVDELNNLISAKKDRDFKPLSDDEKKALSDEDAKTYEEKAKIGLLGNDADLRKMLDNMRQIIYTKVEGVGITMADIGITTGNWTDRGRLTVDDTKLQQALEGKYDEVVSLFTKTSTISDSDMANRGKRTAESGIANRLNDILNDAVRTTAVGYGSKGYLINRAGVQNDGSAVDNAITKQVQNYDDRISKLLEKWYSQEKSYYAMFARMETAMSKMQAQQNSLAQMMAQG